MVSLRRHRLLGLSHGASCSSVLPTEYQNTDVPERAEKTGKSADDLVIVPIVVPHMPSVTCNQAVKPVNKEKEKIEDPSTKKQKIYVQIDPENPVEVHAYLMQLKEENKLEPDLLQPMGEVPAKEWMDERYPHIFRVFPQNPKVHIQFDDKSRQNDFVYCHYWLFIFEVRSIASMDYHISPGYVISLGKVIEDLEKQGFDCRFMRSELVVVGSMMKQQLEILLEEKAVVDSRIKNLEKQLQTATGNDAELHGEMQIANTTAGAEKLPEEHRNPSEHDKVEVGKDEPLSAVLHREYMEVILERFKKVLLCKEAESSRLKKVLEEIKRFHRHKAAIP